MSANAINCHSSPLSCSVIPPISPSDLFFSKELCQCLLIPGVDAHTFLEASSFLVSFKPLSKLHKLWIKSVDYIFLKLLIHSQFFWFMSKLTNKKSIRNFGCWKIFNHRTSYFRIKVIPVTLWTLKTMRASFFSSAISHLNFWRWMILFKLNCTEVGCAFFKAILRFIFISSGERTGDSRRMFIPLIFWLNASPLGTDQLSPF